MKKHIGRALDKAGFKKQGLRVYFFFTNKWKDLIAASRKKLVPLLVRQRCRKGFYAIDLDSDWLGLGARIVKTLEIALYCREKGLTPLIRYNYREKKTNHRGKEKGTPDYFGELFYYKRTDNNINPYTDINIDPDKNKDPQPRFTSIRDIDELGWPEDYNKKLRLAFAKPLFDQYFGINREIVSETELFWDRHLGNKTALGVHYRGTDKAGEAPLVAKEQLLDRVRTTLLERPHLETIFLSTDDESIIRFLQNAGLSVPVLCRQDAVRSNDGGQFHRKREISKSIVNRDAIVNMLILSRCSYLLKTASILSDCSVIFNPAIEIDLINKPHTDTLTWWPCTEIIENQEKANEKLYT